ncbi:MAG: HD domain-containing protein [bacterium]
MEISEFERKIDSKVKERFEASVPRYYDHTLKVVANMKAIMGDHPERDGLLLLAAAYLHDIGYSAPYGSGFAGDIKDQEEKIRVHSKAGSKLAEQILREIGADPSVVSRVSYLVSVHHRGDIDQEDLKLLIQADKV